ncbi:hypothetical protein [Cohnella abietis]|uniref:Uncharacterized protein n=1 Tax=Cohnella abietis TaxID=2507935 RepID=A0A3T1D2Z7_9BACL|nr:hypothetical protein [Cohnella abietis]BBI32470.1 hypothetical protein KCTCHS21_18690 [Cohnella abietis]
MTQPKGMIIGVVGHGGNSMVQAMLSMAQESINRREEDPLTQTNEQLKKYEVLCLLHIYNGLSTTVSKRLITVEAESEESVGNFASEKMRLEYKSSVDWSLSGVTIMSIKEIVPNEQLDHEKKLAEIKSYDDSWWLRYLEEKTIFDADNIKAHKQWLIEEVDRLLEENKRLSDLLKMKETNFSDEEVSEHDFTMQQLHIESKRVREENKKLHSRIQKKIRSIDNLQKDYEYLRAELTVEQKKNINLSIAYGKQSDHLEQVMQEREKAENNLTDALNSIMHSDKELEQLKAELSAKDKVLDLLSSYLPGSDGDIIRTILSQYTKGDTSK